MHSARAAATHAAASAIVNGFSCPAVMAFRAEPDYLAPDAKTRGIALDALAELRSRHRVFKSDPPALAEFQDFAGLG